MKDSKIKIHPVSHHNMQFSVKSYPQYSASVKLSTYKKGQNSVGEYNVMVTLDNPRLPYTQQLKNALAALDDTLNTLPKTAKPVFKRFFLSDATNQAVHLPLDRECATSIIQQPPLNATKLAIWVYLMDNVDIENHNGIIKAKHGSYTHIWQGSANTPYMSSDVATIMLLGEYASMLRKNGCTMADNCLRTWFFVNDVDINYQGLVTGRNQVFSTTGLTAATHFIASTGIGGKSDDPHSLVSFNAYAVQGIKPSQIKYLQAPEYLNPSYDYGVAFERGTSVDYGDRRHVLISGTASIDNKGEIVHPGDVVEQTYRMLDNISALLSDADCDFNDLSYGIVYLRDMADYEVVKDIISNKFPGLPVTIVLAPVCRHGWLIEMECAAIKDIKSEYASL